METKPILLLADSQLLFLKNEEQTYYLQPFVREIVNEKPACAYIGASNGDEPAYFELFTEAMNLIGLFDCKMITSAFTKDEQEYLEKADLILLAGGDAEQGLQVFREKGMEEIIRKRYHEGALLIGVSAGAIQLGWQSFKNVDGQKNIATEGFKLIPFIVLVHLDKTELEKIDLLLRDAETIKRAYEIPTGGGLIFHHDYTVEAIRKPINEFILKDDNVTHTLIFPKDK